MKIKELLVEISAGEKKRQKKAAADEERRRQLALRQAEQERLQVQAKKRLERRYQQFSELPKKQEEPVVPQTGTFANLDPNLFYDPRYHETEGTEDIGVYLKFYREQRNSEVFSYYSKYSYISWAGANEYVPKPIVSLGRRFNGKKFQALIDRLIEETSTPQAAGYVNIIINREFIDKTKPALNRDGDRFFTEMLIYLQQHYPQNGQEMDATVYWELI